MSFSLLDPRLSFPVLTHIPFCRPGDDTASCLSSIASQASAFSPARLPSLSQSHEPQACRRATWGTRSRIFAASGGSFAKSARCIMRVVILPGHLISRSSSPSSSSVNFWLGATACPFDCRQIMATAHITWRLCSKQHLRIAFSSYRPPEPLTFAMTFLCVA